MEGIVKLFKNYGIDMMQEQAKKFDLFFHHLVETNRNLNLTAITERKEVEVKHFLDSVLPFKLFPTNATVVDVGSGAGFPAIPLKIVREDLSFCMVDSLNKRVNFLEETISKLELKNATAVHARAEDFAKDHRESFDVAVARAVAGLSTLVEYLLPLVKVGGIAIIYKSSKLEEELEEASKAIEVLGGKVEEIQQFQISEGNLERNVLLLRKVVKTPLKYPRGQNKPKLYPIK